ncbi:LysR substrate-binding domain-containing protein [Propylenella binzhouense]|uniref:LysR family transcriptional regulator n=1 Tax=Propylenella binzhouense TaxID=2555902 RepID=A0A964T5F9_9HYPH|nr:LysR substrate-binding domain-containing protein [Propylenella binzhouense]MYZ48871.1 LysR family transcriptional regulator [Propylenella binzhouense]
MSLIELDAEREERGGSDGLEFRAGAGLDVDLLRTLVAIADTGSFNRAARQVFRTPSAVSMQMKKLEEQVGRALFAKDGRSVALTPDGEALVGYGRRIMKLTQEALQRFRAPGIEGTIRLGTPDDYAGRFLPDILARFAASHPLVEVDVVCQASVDLMRMVEENAIDIALVSAGHGQNGGHILHREPLVWAGLRHGCAHEQRPLPLALSHLGCCWRKMALEALDRSGVDYRIAYSSRHYLGQLAALMAGLAIAPLPQSSVRGELKAIGDEAGLPPIGQLAIEMRRAPAAAGPLFDALANHIEENFSGYGAVAA